MKLSIEELKRYNRHIIIPNFGIESQIKLKNAKILVVGAGGLGCPLLLYLAAAGVGTIGIIDEDVVDESNLQRQILYDVNSIGLNKAFAAKQKLIQLNPFSHVVDYQLKITTENALDLIKGYDIVVDGTDNFPTRYLINDACVMLGKSIVYASINQFEGQISVFNFTHINGTIGPNYRDLYPEPPHVDDVPNCSEAGVLGVLPGIIGSLQANEVIKMITGIGEVLSGKLLLFNALTLDKLVLEIAGSEDNRQIYGLIDYEAFCDTSKQTNINEIEAETLYEWLQKGEDFQLIDVRKEEEYLIENIGGLLLPFHSIEENLQQIEKNKKVVIHCKSGVRSLKAISKLQRIQNFENLYNLKGGIESYLKFIKNQ